MRIGIVGIDNSHVDRYVDMLNVRHLFPGVSVTALCDADRERAEALAGQGDIESLVESPTDLIGSIDAAIVAGRHGGTHAAGAIPLLSAGVPVLVDKPFATTVADAEAIIAAARAGGAVVTSYSALRWAADVQAVRDALAELGDLQVVVATGRADPQSPYGGEAFYGVHTVEAALHIVEERAGASELSAMHVRRLGATTMLTATVGPCQIVVNLVTPGADTVIGFHVLGVAANGIVARDVELDADYLRPGLQRFLTMISSGQAVLSDERLLAPVRVLAALSG